MKITCAVPAANPILVQVVMMPEVKRSLAGFLSAKIQPKVKANKKSTVVTPKIPQAIFWFSKIKAPISWVTPQVIVANRIRAMGDACDWSFFCHVVKGLIKQATTNGTNTNVAKMRTILPRSNDKEALPNKEKSSGRLKGMIKAEATTCKRVRSNFPPNKTESVGVSAAEEEPKIIKIPSGKA